MEGTRSLGGIVLEGKGGAEGTELRVGGAGLALELQTDLDEVEGVGGAAGDDGSYAAFNEALDAHRLEINRIRSRSKKEERLHLRSGSGNLQNLSFARERERLRDLI